MPATKPGDISQANAHLVGMWLQFIATGAYVVYLPHCVLILYQKMRQGLSPWLPVGCLLICIATMIDFVAVMVRSYQGYSTKFPGELIDPAVIYSDPSSTLSLIKNAMNIAVGIISDAIMVYRTYVVWNMNIWAAALPFGLLMGDTAVGLWAYWTLTQTKAGTTAILAAVSLRIRYFFVITFVLNLVCSGMICFQIWRIQNRVTHDGRTRSGERSPSSKVIEIIIESAGIYCAHLFILIVTNIVGTNYFFVFLDPLPPVGAYVFSMMIVRSRSSKSEGSSAHNGNSITSGTTIRFRGSRSARPPVSIGVEIDLERVVDTESVAGQRVYDVHHAGPYSPHDKDAMAI
ncbi:hypothetical protein BD413DRAFT_167301 [Trametes elegans]|nr:hypothetical protein BD413DRAFT_167301 [Trametes elegans]